MTDAIARVANVSHQYGATVALADVSIAIPSRIMIGVIGPDGVGKSTLLGLIAGVKTILQDNLERDRPWT
jgi:ribosome-dependent ATPase